MSDYIIGLDFGTYQTKASINHLDRKPQKHEFFEFGEKKKKSFFFPSKVSILENGLIKYGDYTEKGIKYTFNYFKMASAEDARFQVTNDALEPIYNYKNSYKGYTPEFLSVLYITYVLLLIKEHYQKNTGSTNIGRIGGLFAGLRRQTSEANNFTIRMGIPTEYSKEVNFLRRRKFETMLLISEMIQKELKYSLKEYLKLGEDDLKILVERFNKQVPKNESEFDKMIKDNHLSVFPESAAGLLYFVKSGKLNKGIYAAIDIGGGTTDMSFFNVYDGKIKYYTSDSYMMACNNIYLNCNSGENTLENIKKTEQEIIESLQGDNWETNSRYTSAVSDLMKKIGDHLKKMINVTSSYGPLSKFSNAQIMKTMKDQPIIVYGGGLAHPQIEGWEEILIYDNGSKYTLNSNLLTYMEIRDINLYKPDKTIILNKNWEQHFSFLIVSFGLSYLHRLDETYWDDSDYKSIKLEKILKEVPHPTNEGMYVYKVIEGKWGD